MIKNSQKRIAVHRQSALLRRTSDLTSWKGKAHTAPDEKNYESKILSAQTDIDNLAKKGVRI
jgi:hypothetical protein